MPDMITNIQTLVNLQQRLLDSFRERFPETTDWQFLLDAPKSGEVAIDGQTWRFRKHGGGLSFESSQGILVDVHRCLTAPNGVDAWRLLRYLESQHDDEQRWPSDERSVKAVLEELRDVGALKFSDYDRLYRLAR